MSEYPRLIRRYLAAYPGSHLRLIQRELNIALGTLRYHLIQMEKRGEVTSHSMGRLRGYFVTGAVDNALKPHVMMLRNERPREIVVHLLESGAATPGEMAEAFRVSSSSLSMYLQMLLRGGLLNRRKAGGKVLYDIADPELATEALRIPNASLADNLVDASLHVSEE